MSDLENNVNHIEQFKQENEQIIRSFTQSDGYRSKYKQEGEEFEARVKEIEKRNLYLNQLNSDPDFLTPLEHFKENIDHIIILMLENRSFDNLLGYLSIEGEGDLPLIDGIIKGKYVNFYPEKKKRFPFSLSNKKIKHTQEKMSDILQKAGYSPMGTNSITRFPADPMHTIKDTQEQIQTVSHNGVDIENGNYVKNFAETPWHIGNKFQRNNPGAVMGYYTANEVPVFNYLSKHFFICDHWYSSIPGPTTPNRAFAVAGSSETTDHYDKNIFYRYNVPLIDNDATNTIIPGTNLYSATTIFEILTEAKINWKYYYGDFAQLWTFKTYFDRLKSPNNDVLKDVLNSFSGLDRFKIDVRSSDRKAIEHRSLAPVSWIDPNFGGNNPNDQNDDHSTADISAGQKLVFEILDAFYDHTAPNGGEWRDIFYKSMIFIVYDEHGGFYDHRTPPLIPDGLNHPSQETKKKKKGTYGVRVPSIIVSPFINSRYYEMKKEGIFYDHMTLMKTIIDRFDLQKLVEDRMHPNLKYAIPLDLNIFDFSPRPKIPPFNKNHLNNSEPYKFKWKNFARDRLKKLSLTLNFGTASNNHELFPFMKGFFPYPEFIRQDYSIESFHRLLDHYNLQLDQNRKELTRANIGRNKEELQKIIEEEEAKLRQNFVLHIDDLRNLLRLKKKYDGFNEWLKDQKGIALENNYVKFTEFGFGFRNTRILIDKYMDYLLLCNLDYAWMDNDERKYLF